MGVCDITGGVGADGRCEERCEGNKGRQGVEYWTGADAGLVQVLSRIESPGGLRRSALSFGSSVSCSSFSL